MTITFCNKLVVHQSIMESKLGSLQPTFRFQPTNAHVRYLGTTSSKRSENFHQVLAVNNYQLKPQTGWDALQKLSRV